MEMKPDVVVFGASSGGTTALCTILKALHPNFGAAILVVVHSGRTSTLDSILSRCGNLEAKIPEHGQVLHRGCVYIAPPGRHLSIHKGRIQLTDGFMENRHRPAVDPLFRSAAREFRKKVLGVVLSGALDDGSADLLSIQCKGGITIVQDPRDADVPDMPRNAMKHLKPDFCVPAARIGSLLMKLVGVRKKSIVRPPAQKPLRRLPHLSQIISNIQVDALERGLWIALDVLTQRRNVQKKLAENHRENGETEISRRIGQTIAAADRDILVLRELLGKI